MFSSSSTDTFACHLAKWDLSMASFMIKFQMNYFWVSYKMHILERNNKIHVPEKSKTGCSDKFLPTGFSVRKLKKLTITRSLWYIYIFLGKKKKRIFVTEKIPHTSTFYVGRQGFCIGPDPDSTYLLFLPCFQISIFFFFFYWKDVLWLLLPLFISYAEVGILDLSQMFSHEDKNVRDPDHGHDRVNDKKRKKSETLPCEFSKVWRQPLLLGKQKYF